jgi:hypothetical protein
MSTVAFARFAVNLKPMPPFDTSWLTFSAIISQMTAWSKIAAVSETNESDLGSAGVAQRL